MKAVREHNFSLAKTYFIRVTWRGLSGEVFKARQGYCLAGRSHLGFSDQIGRVGRDDL